MKMKWSILMHIVLGLVMAAAFGLAVMLLWNLLVPDIFGLKTISFWQALGLLVLARLLFGGTGHAMRGNKMHRHHNPIHDRWMKMTPEEKREFINKRHKFFHKFSFENESKEEKNV
jgi:hypothetical protein